MADQAGRKIDRHRGVRATRPTSYCFMAFLMVSVCVLTSPQRHTSPASPAPKAGSILTWSDEFNESFGSAPDPAKWLVETGGNGWVTTNRNTTPRGAKTCVTRTATARARSSGRTSSLMPPDAAHSLSVCCDRSAAPCPRRARLAVTKARPPNCLVVAHKCAIRRVSTPEKSKGRERSRCRRPCRRSAG